MLITNEKLSDFPIFVCKLYHNMNNMRLNSVPKQNPTSRGLQIESRQQGHLSLNEGKLPFQHAKTKRTRGLDSRILSA
jgi:hypothetical protein